MKLFKGMTVALAAGVGGVLMAGPSVSNVTMSQASGSRLVTVEYTLDAPAIVTVDFVTNNVSIGGSKIWKLAGDVNKKVEAGTHTITWRPDISWPGEKIDAAQVSAAVTAWALDNPPDYMVVELAEVSDNRVSYYASADFLPGGLLTSDLYRTSKLVMKRIPAGGVTWTMGNPENTSIARTHSVTLADDYYMGVFPITQQQWRNVCGGDGVANAALTDANGVSQGFSPMFPRNNIGYRRLREADAMAATVANNSAYDWPNDPNPASFIGRLRTKTGNVVALDLPSEAQWEFAARGGHGFGFWGNGATFSSPTIKGLGATTDSVTRGGYDVGSFAPNDYGLYDVHGLVYEWCLDWYKDDVTDNSTGEVIASTTQEVPGNGKCHVVKGGCWWEGFPYAEPAYRGKHFPNWDGPGSAAGLRVAAPLCDRY